VAGSVVLSGRNASRGVSATAYGLFELLLVLMRKVKFPFPGSRSVLVKFQLIEYRQGF